MKSAATLGPLVLLDFHVQDEFEVAKPHPLVEGLLNLSGTLKAPVLKRNPWFNSPFIRGKDTVLSRDEAAEFVASMKRNHSVWACPSQCSGFDEISPRRGRPTKLASSIIKNKGFSPECEFVAWAKEVLREAASLSALSSATLTWRFSRDVKDADTMSVSPFFSSCMNPEARGDYSDARKHLLADPTTALLTVRDQNGVLYARAVIKLLVTNGLAHKWTVTVDSNRERTVSTAGAALRLAAGRIGILQDFDFGTKFRTAHSKVYGILELDDFFKSQGIANLATCPESWTSPGIVIDGKVDRKKFIMRVATDEIFGYQDEGYWEEPGSPDAERHQHYPENPRFHRVTYWTNN